MSLTATAISTIRDAFAEVERGAGRTLEEADVLSFHPGDAARLRAARERAETMPWWRIPDDELEAWGDSVSFLDKAGYLYALPALMTWSLGRTTRQFHEGCSMTVVESLGRPSKSGRRFTPCPFRDAMSPGQQGAVRAYLRAAGVDFGCATALAILRFWPEP